MIYKSIIQETGLKLITAKSSNGQQNQSCGPFDM